MIYDNVLITGMGTISASGRNLGDSLKSMGSGQRNCSDVTLFSTPLAYPVFEVKEIQKKFYLEGSRTLSLALCAVDEALKDAELDNIKDYRVGVCMGTTVASQLNDVEFYTTYRKTGSALMTPVDRYLEGNLADFIMKKFSINGPALTVVNACSSGTDAIGIALSWLRGGLCDIAIAGGADELNHVPLCGFGSLGVVSQTPCAPFDRDRKGLNLGEGAGALVLETETSSRRRGKKTCLQLCGYGSSADAYHLTAPHPEGTGLKRAITRALSEAKIKQQEVGFINAHGTATQDNDKVEGKALKELFGKGVNIFSTKGFTGHTLGAAGGIEAVYTVAGLKEGWIPGNAGFKNIDDEIGLSPVTEKTSVDANYAMSTSLAFGGNNSALVFALRT